jgi:hypothetical protein
MLDIVVKGFAVKTERLFRNKKAKRCLNAKWRRGRDLSTNLLVKNFS